MAARWDKKPTAGVTPKLPKGAKGKLVKLPGLDPYVRWALHTRWRGFARLVGDDLTLHDDQAIQIIACAADDSTLDQALNNSPLQISSIYAKPIHSETKQRALHISAKICKKHFAWLLDNPLGLRWQLALPHRDAERAAKALPKGWFGPDRDRQKIHAPNVVKTELAAAKPLRNPRKIGGAIAVIDFGCSFLHEAFRQGKGTRVAALWDQGSHATPEANEAEIEDRVNGWPWNQPARFNYGRELGPDAMGTMVQALSSKRELEESAIYRGIDYLIDYHDPRRRVWFATHGGHLLDVAGGKPDPLTQDRRKPDKAASAKLLFVQLPLLAAMDSGCGALGAHLLDGVRYALSLMSKPSSPLVVNISYGGQAGPHDGSSLIESAFDELLLARKKNFAIVLAAGNSRQSFGHASRVVKPGRSVMLRLGVPAADTTDTFVEIWYKKPVSSAHIEVRVLTPDHLWSPWVTPGQEIVIKDSDVYRDTVALLRHDTTVPNGRRAMALLALAPTAQPDEVPGAVAQAGEWAIEVRLVDSLKNRKKPLHTAIDAWVERDDPARRSGRGQAHFIDQTNTDGRDTRSSIATGTYTVVVGGFNLERGEPATYSSLGPDGGNSPWVQAACEEDESNPSINAAATRSGEMYRLNGTSVAAPVVARRLYNVMVQKKTALQRTSRKDQVRLAVEAMADDPAQCFIKRLDAD